MAQTPLTDRMLKTLAPPSSGQHTVWDSKIPAFGVRVSSGGSKSFVLMYRINGRSRRLTLGRYPTVTLSDARTRARDALHQVSRGVDPAEQKATSRTSARSSRFQDVVDRFIEQYAKRHTKRWAETQRILNDEFGSKWRSRELASITAADISERVQAICDRPAPAAANLAFATIRKFFNWTVEQGLLDDSPCRKMRKPAKSTTRDRVLSDSELSSIYQAGVAMDYPFGTIVRLLILTGQRRSEIGGLRWDDIDYEQRVISFSREQMKSGRAHEVPLTGSAIEIIKSIPHDSSVFVFPARGNTERVFSGYSKSKRRLDQLSDVSDWRLHDIRRTVSTGLARKGVPPHVIERILDHQNGEISGVAAIYNRFGYLSEMRDALERWERYVMTLATEPKSV